MLDGRQIEREYKAEQRRLKEERSKYASSDDSGAMIGIVLFLGFGMLAGLVAMQVYFSEEGKNDCEKVDGEYVIVDRTFAGNSAVDIYGCVK